MFLAVSIAANDYLLKSTFIDVYAGASFPAIKNAYNILWKINCGLRIPDSNGTCTVGIVYGTGNAVKTTDNDKVYYYGLFEGYSQLSDSAGYSAMRDVKASLVAIEILGGYYIKAFDRDNCFGFKAGIALDYETFQGKLLNNVTETLGWQTGLDLPVSIEVKIKLFEFDKNKIYLYLEPEVWINLNHGMVVFLNTNLGWEF